MATEARRIAANVATRIYGFPPVAQDGALIAYGPDAIEMYHAAGQYSARIVKGEKPADLPVQQPTHFQLVINGHRKSAWPQPADHPACAGRPGDRIARRFPPPWTVEELEACFVVKDASGQKLG
jgi:hypothetical protein